MSLIETIAAKVQTERTYTESWNIIRKAYAFGPDGFVKLKALADSHGLVAMLNHDGGFPETTIFSVTFIPKELKRIQRRRLKPKKSQRPRRLR